VSRRLLILIVVTALAATACSSPKAAPSAAPKPPSTTAAPTTTTTLAPPPTTRTLHGVVPADLLEQAEAFYAWVADPSETQPRGVTPELAAHVAGVSVTPGLVYARAATANLENGDRVAGLTGRDDVLFYVDTGGGWRIVGANLEGLDPWLGSDSPRTLLVLGSDARVGENQLGQRADSVHVLTMVPATGEGAFVGFPRDSWVRGSKLTNLLPRGGPDLMVEVIEEITSLEMDGWVAVGFEGFLGLIGELGSLQIDLPRAMRSGNNWDDYPAGKQSLTPQLALRLARIRKGLPAGDFDRSFNQGLVMLAALVMVQRRGILELPRWVAAFDRHGFTDLDTGELLTWLATAYVTDMDKITNVVVPGTNATAGAAAIVRISPSAEDLFRDLDDGVLDT
jgi:LCP family protein required for cell wall assembly